MNVYLKEFTLAKIEATTHLRNFYYFHECFKKTFCSEHFPVATFAIVNHFDAIDH